ANVTATGAVAGRPAAVAAATAGQSIHQMASTRDTSLTGRTFGTPGPHESAAAGPHGQPDPADPAATGDRSVPTGTGQVIPADPGFQPGRGGRPVPIGDQQRAALLPGAGHHRPRPRR